MRSHIIIMIPIVLILKMANTQPMMELPHQPWDVTPTVIAVNDICHDAQSNEASFLIQYDSRICRTPELMCTLPQPGPNGATCWCIGDSGPVKGKIVSE